MNRAPRGFWFGAWRVTERNLRVFQRFAGASALGNFGEPLLYLLALGYGLGRIVPAVNGMSYAEFIAPGLVVSTVMYTATFEGTFGSYTRLDTQRTFDAILATPVTVGELVAGEVIWGGVKASFGAAIVLSVIRMFGLVASWSALWVIPLGFAAGLMFTTMALVVTALSESYESFNYYFTLVVAPMFLFSGIFFPLQQLPPWVDRVAQLLPLTHAVELARGCVRGTAGVSQLVHLGAIAGFTVVAYVACRLLLERRLRV
jgi:lipooligosaccharide transport system permease protein